MKAQQIDICVFTSTGKNKVFTFDNEGNISGINFDQLTNNERLAFNEAEAAMNAIAAKAHGLQYNVWVCPRDYNNNVVPIEQQGFGLNLPAILITGYYPGGDGKQYALRNDVGGGKNWSRSDIGRYINALYTGKTEGSNESLICKIFPPLCNIGAYLWLAAAGVSAYKTAEMKGRPALQTIWGAATLLSIDAFLKGGGLQKLGIKK